MDKNQIVAIVVMLVLNCIWVVTSYAEYTPGQSTVIDTCDCARAKEQPIGSVSTQTADQDSRNLGHQTVMAPAANHEIA